MIRMFFFLNSCAIELYVSGDFQYHFAIFTDEPIAHFSFTGTLILLQTESECFVSTLQTWCVSQRFCEIIPETNPQTNPPNRF